MSMSSAGSAARLWLVLVLLKLSPCLTTSGLRVREEWTDVDGVFPRLWLQTSPHDTCVRVHLSMPPLMANEKLQIDFNISDSGDSDKLFLWRSNHVLQWVSSSDYFFEPHRTKIQMREAPTASHQAFWLLRYRCFWAPSGSTVSVSAHTQQRALITRVFTISDPVPKASVSVNEHDKHFTVKMKTTQLVNVGLCLKQFDCLLFNYSGQVNTSVHPAVQLSFPFLIPCVCVQLWFRYPDSRRNTQCPLKDRILPHGGDVLSSSSVRVLGSVLHWEPLCPLDQSQPSVSLCWRIPTQDSPCVPAPKGTLNGTKLEYNVSAVDQHPQMCVKFSLNGSRRVFCPFESEGRSEWSVRVVPGSLSLCALVSSDVAAAFAAQLCVRKGDTCEARGHIVTQWLDRGAVDSELLVSFPFLSSGLCVQVWRVDLHGRRLFCPDFSHRRWGLVFGTAVALLTALVALLCVTCVLLKRSTSVWRDSERRPVLLVCSSNDPAHVSAVCSLASGLQGELRMDVRLAQWAQCRAQSSLAQLGPVPWLYSQCQSVQRAGGLVLIAWSPGAQQAFRRWRRSTEPEHLDGGLPDSSLMAPVFAAALSCLWTGIRSDGHGQGFRLLCFQSLDNEVLIPKALHCVRKYCLPKDLCSLIHELMGRRDVPGKMGSCRPRLLSKVLAFLASRKLAPRIKAALPEPDKLTHMIPPKLKSSTKPKTHRQKRWRREGLSCSKTAPELLRVTNTPL